MVDSDGWDYIRGEQWRKATEYVFSGNVLKCNFEEFVLECFHILYSSYTTLVTSYFDGDCTGRWLAKESSVVYIHTDKNISNVLLHVLSMLNITYFKTFTEVLFIRVTFTYTSVILL